MKPSVPGDLRVFRAFASLFFRHMASESIKIQWLHSSYTKILCGQRLQTNENVKMLFYLLFGPKMSTFCIHHMEGIDMDFLWKLLHPVEVLAAVAYGP